MNDLSSLLNRYKINIHTIFQDDKVLLEKLGIIIEYSQKKLISENPHLVCIDVLNKFIDHPDYLTKSMEYYDKLPRRQIVNVVTLSVDDKKSMIRKKLIEKGFIGQTI